MGQLDFEYGYNDPDYKTHDPPTYQQACMGMMICPHCGKSAICGDVPGLPGERGYNMPDLSKYKGEGGFPNARLPWLDGDALPSKGATLRIDAARMPRKQSNVVVYLDVTLGKKKYTWSIRKGFTLDALMEELGTNSDKWTGKSVKVVKGGDAGQYVNVSQQ